MHSAFCYRSDAEYVAGVVPFIEAGLAAGEAVTVAVPTDRLALLTASLGSAANRPLMLDMTEAGRNPGRILPGIMFASADAHPDRTVRIVGETVWPGRSAAERAACVVHEALLNRAFTGRQVMALCPYDGLGLDSKDLVEVATTHPELIDAQHTRRSDRFAPDEILAAYNVPLSPPDNADTYIVDTPNMAGLRSAAGKFAGQHELGEDRTAELVLALTELASNSIEHAHDSATVLFGITGNRIVCQVRDKGHITDPLAGRRLAPPQQLRGRGLLLVNEVADLVRIHTIPGSTTVEIQFAMDAAAR